MPSVRMLTAGEQALLIELGDSIDPALNSRVHNLCRRVTDARWPGVLEIVPSYRSALLLFDPLIITRMDLEQRLTRLIDEPAPARAAYSRPRLVTIPVCYGGEFGPDLDFVAGHSGLSPEQVIQIHCARPLRIYMLGFMPGFPYLGGMDERIAAPRLPRPRTRIPAGSVGIAGSQTGFYPYESPGGWRLIGRTPVKPFNPASPEPFIFAAGDSVQFRSVSPDDYERIRRDVEAGSYVPESGELPAEPRAPS